MSNLHMRKDKHSADREGEGYDVSDVRDSKGNPVQPNSYDIRDSQEMTDSWPLFLQVKHALQPIFDWIAERVSHIRHSLIS